MSERLCFIDIETTGFSPEFCDVIELAAQATDLEGRPVGPAFNSFVKTARPLPLKISRLTGIKPEDLKDAPTFAQIAPAFLEYIGGAPLVGHNSRSFDAPFLNFKLSSLELPTFKQPVLDTLDLAFFAEPLRPRLSEAELVRDLLGETERHRALSDTLHLIRLFQRFRESILARPAEYLDFFGPMARQLEWDWAFLFPPGKGAAGAGLKFKYPQVRLEERKPAAEIPDCKPVSEEEVARQFAAGGWVDKACGGQFQARPGQVDMALEITRSLNQGKHQALEAGTGTGKTYAYLVPTVLFAEANQVPVLISTHTRLLQEQLRRDIQRLGEARGQAVEFVVLKGLRNYLCLKRWAEYAPEPSPEAEASLHRFEKMFLLNWLYFTREGNLQDELPYVIQRRLAKSLFKRLTVEEDCPGRACPHFSQCYAMKARQDAAQAELIVTNHAMTLGSVLGTSGAVPAVAHYVFDESHHLESVATAALTREVSGRGLYELLDELSPARGRGSLEEWAARATGPESAQACGQAEQACRETKLLIPSVFSQDLLDWIKSFASEDDLSEEGRRVSQLLLETALAASPAWQAFKPGLHLLASKLALLARTLGRILDQDDGEQGAPDAFARRRMINLAQDLAAAAAQLQSFCEPTADRILYFETAAGLGGLLDSGWETLALALKSAPFQPARDLKALLYDTARSCLFLSATLTTSSENRKLTPMRLRTGWYCGQDDRWREFREFPSPFDYDRQMRLEIMDIGAEYRYDLDRGRSFFEAVNRLLPGLLAGLEGGSLVLCTAHAHVDRLFPSSERLVERQGVAVYRQARGQNARALVEKFREEGGSCLFGTLSLWEGLDVPGDSLKNVIIVKLPFDHPEDPVLKARMSRFQEYVEVLPAGERNGLKPLHHYYKPLMMIKLRQGAGRLIRTESDSGRLIFLDGRLRTSQKSTFSYIQRSFGFKNAPEKKKKVQPGE